MNTHNSNERGQANHGWLNSYFSFSFADYYNPKMMEYGTLRVLNDDTIAPNTGFPSHSHKDMEIITIVTKGELRHEDNTGKLAILTPGWVQVMSAGTGIIHSEFNNSKTHPLELFQIWIQTKSSIKPKHNEKKFELKKGINVVAGGKGLQINQDATVSLGLFDSGEKFSLSPKKGKGIFMMVIEGLIKTKDTNFSRRDAISFEEELKFLAEKNSEILIIEVPFS